MKKISDETKSLARKLLLMGYTVKAVEAETGLSNGTVKAIKKELKLPGHENSSNEPSAEEGDLSCSDYITKAEQKYIQKLEGEVKFYEDEDEGWLFHLSIEERKKKTSGIWFGFIMYPTKEDPDGVLRINRLRCTGLELAISPLHDKDKNDKGEKKKAHWHGIIKSPVKIGYNDINETIRNITYGPYISKIMSLKGAYEYFVHLNHPEKYQYDKAEIQTYNGFTIEPNSREKKELLASIFTEIIDDQELDSYSKLTQKHKHEVEYLYVAATHIHAIKTLLKENWRKNNPDYVSKVQIVHEDYKNQGGYDYEDCNT